jgi:hypothetical protein
MAEESDPESAEDAIQVRATEPSKISTLKILVMARSSLKTNGATDEN